MHILFLSHNFPPEVNALATRTFEHCRRWVAQGHRVTVITCAPNYPRGVVFPGYRNAWRTEETMSGIRVVRVGTLIAANEGLLRRTVYYLSYMLRAAFAGAALRDVDVIVSSSPQFFGGWAGALCKRIRRRPFVLEVRDLWPESILAVGAMERTAFIRFLEWLEQRMYAAADHIVTVGDGYRRQLVARGVPPTKIDVVPNGIDAESARPRFDPRDVRRGLGAERKFVCAYVGTIGMAHGLGVVLDAAERARLAGRRDVEFWLVGDGAERRSLEREADRRRLDNVRFLGLVPRDRVASYVAAADACLVHLRGAALFETVIPSKIFETMAAETPIVMGVRGDACRIVVEQGAGVAMTPDDGESLLQCLDRIAANPGAYRNGRAFVLREYNRDSLALQMLDAILRTAARRDMGGVSAPGGPQTQSDPAMESRRKAA
ncbi:MAG: glycosyltransferase family 4 protein [Planctomycetes bacterium]|nr:glycosyltransferase family 4 protein [Planctomycetota bacterium]